MIRGTWSIAWAIGPALGAFVIGRFDFRGVFMTSALCVGFAIILLASARVPAASPKKLDSRSSAHAESSWNCSSPVFQYYQCRFSTFRFNGWSVGSDLWLSIHVHRLCGAERVGIIAASFSAPNPLHLRGVAERHALAVVQRVGGCDSGLSVSIAWRARRGEVTYRAWRATRSLYRHPRIRVLLAHYCCSANRLRSFSKIGSARIRGMVTAAVNAAATIPTVRLE